MSDTTNETIADLAEITPISESRIHDRKAQARAAILNGPITTTLMRLALPTIAVLLAQTAVSVAETYYVGYLGTDALAGVSLVFPVYMLMVTISNGGLGSGVASSVARAIGAGRQRDADAIVLHAIVLAAIMGAIFTLTLLFACLRSARTWPRADAPLRSNWRGRVRAWSNPAITVSDRDVAG